MLKMASSCVLTTLKVCSEMRLGCDHEQASGWKLWVARGANVVFSPTKSFHSMLIGTWKPGGIFEPNFSTDGPPIPLYCSPYSPESLLDMDHSFRRNLGENDVKGGETNTYWMNQWVVGWRNQGRLPTGGMGLILSCKNWCMLVQFSSVAQSCLTFVTPWTIATASSVRGISQARILEWVAISFSKGSSQSRDWTHISCVSCLGRWILYG